MSAVTGGTSSVRARTGLGGSYGAQEDPGRPKTYPHRRAEVSDSR